MELHFLRDLYRLPGPFASAYLDASRSSEDALTRLDLSRRQVREDLAAAGADPATTDAVVEALSAAPDGAATGRVAFAAAGQVGWAGWVPVPPPVPARWEPLPDVVPLLLAARPRSPHVRVLMDRTGADITVPGGRDERVRGKTWPLTKVREGGSAQNRYQRGAEETWRDNAADSADAVVAAAESVDAELIVVGGDVRARDLLLAALPEALRDIAVVAEPGARHDPQPFHAEADAMLDGRQAALETAVAGVFRELAPKGGAVQGLQGTAAALRDGRVETLLFGGEPAGELWYGAEPGLLGADAGELRAMGVEKPRQTRSGSALARAAAHFGAAAEYTPDLDLADQVGAILRFIP